MEAGQMDKASVTWDLIVLAAWLAISSIIFVAAMIPVPS
jgi:hypothetical protein